MHILKFTILAIGATNAMVTGSAEKSNNQLVVTTTQNSLATVSKPLVTAMPTYNFLNQRNWDHGIPGLSALQAALYTNNRFQVPGRPRTFTVPARGAPYYMTATPGNAEQLKPGFWATAGKNTGYLSINPTTYV